MNYRKLQQLSSLLQYVIRLIHLFTSNLLPNPKAMVASGTLTSGSTVDRRFSLRQKNHAKSN